MRKLSYILTLLALLTVLTVNGQTSSVDYSMELQGRFIHDSAKTAGFEIIGKRTIIWITEITWTGFVRKDTMAICWLDNRTFVIKDIKRINEDCPPRNWIYRVEHFDGTKLILTDFWTGWGEFPNEQIKLTQWIEK